MSGGCGFEVPGGVAWQVVGFGDDGGLCSETPVTAEQVAALRPQLDVGDDVWLCNGSYALPRELWSAVRAAVPGIELCWDVVYFIEAYQNA